MSQQKLPLIVKVSSSLNTAIFDCGIYCNNWQMSVYSTSAVKLNLVKFHSGTSAWKPHDRIFISLDKKPECDGMTDGQTDGQKMV